MTSNIQSQNSLIEVCRKLRIKGLVNATHGNLSVREDNLMYITPTGCDLETVMTDDLVAVDIESGRTVSSGRPSKEYEMHLMAYRNRPDITAVVHAHSPKTVAAACLPDADFDDLLPSYTLAFALFTRHLPVVGYFKAGSHELALAASEKLKNHNAVLLAHHGLITVSDTIMKAYYRLEEIEEKSEIALSIGLKGNRALDPDSL